MSENLTPATAAEERYVASRFVSLSHDEDGSLVVHSSRTGAIGVVPEADAKRARQALLPHEVTTGPLDGVLADLAAGGLLVPMGTDEARLANDAYITKYTDRSLHLIVMPTEQCNFRCVYCYESFLRGEMSTEIQQGIKKYVDGQELDALVLSWFGGEPLLAKDVVADLTGHFQERSAERGYQFFAGATTNGSLLTPEYADRVIPLGLRSFQITLDGIREEHDQRRVGAHGEKTFATILGNLRHLRNSSHDFTVSIRHNFDPANFDRLDEFIEMIAGEFGGDSRFAMEFSPIGRWGGENDENLLVCEGRSIYDALLDARKRASKAGFGDMVTRRMMQPNGAVCYAANPRSFVIGSDGQLYKCTVELDYHDRNIVGRLRPDGHMELNWQKMALWTETNGMQEGKKCVSCYFSPACHGAVCPKEWMEEPECNCPPVKHGIRQHLTLIKAESLFDRPPRGDVPSCAK